MEYWVVDCAKSEVRIEPAGALDGLLSRGLSRPNALLRGLCDDSSRGVAFALPRRVVSSVAPASLSHSAVAPRGQAAVGADDVDRALGQVVVVNELVGPGFVVLQRYPVDVNIGDLQSAVDLI